MMVATYDNDNGVDDDVSDDVGDDKCSDGGRQKSRRFITD